MGVAFASAESRKHLSHVLGEAFDVVRVLADETDFEVFDVFANRPSEGFAVATNAGVRLDGYEIPREVSAEDSTFDGRYLDVPCRVTRYFVVGKIPPADPCIHLCYEVLVL